MILIVFLTNLAFSLTFPNNQDFNMTEEPLQSGFSDTYPNSPSLLSLRNNPVPFGDPCCETPVLSLLQFVVHDYFEQCILIVVFDDFYASYTPSLLTWLLRNFPFTVRVVLRWSDARRVQRPGGDDGGCRQFVFLLRLLEESEAWDEALPAPADSRVLLVTKSRPPIVVAFLRRFFPLKLLNVLVASDPVLNQTDGFDGATDCRSRDVILYRPGARGGAPVSAWRCDALTQRDARLFAARGGGGGGTDGGWAALRSLRHVEGWGGARELRVAVAPAPPYVLRRERRDEHGNIETWDGSEIRLVKILAETLGLHVRFFEANDSVGDGGSEGGGGGAATAAVAAVESGEADVAAAGVYHSAERARVVALGVPHAEDCAAFVTRTFLALPRYRAIMGPFHWSVWLALTLAYLFAIFPLAFSLRHSLRHLFRKPTEIENMFWYVFGTFTNCFTFVGKDSWSGGRNSSTLMLIGCYWLFSIIITACYTGSIIAFVTLPVFPSVVDSSEQILRDKYLVGTVGNGEWNKWFMNSSDPISEELLTKMEYLPSVIDGLRNVSSSYFRPYAFLGSREFLEYVIRTNYTPDESSGRRAKLHLARECFVPLRVSLAFSRRTALAAAMDAALLRAEQSGLAKKAVRDARWSLALATARNANDSAVILLKPAVISSVRALRSEEKMLSLDDIQGTFLLLGAGFAIAFFALFWECISNMIEKCKAKQTVSEEISSNASSLGIAFEMDSLKPPDEFYPHSNYQPSRYSF